MYTAFIHLMVSIIHHFFVCLTAKKITFFYLTYCFTKVYFILYSIAITSSNLLIWLCNEDSDRSVVNVRFKINK